MRMVSPMPYGRSWPSAAALFMAPGSLVPASVTPRCNGASECLRNRLLASTISGTWLALRETLKSKNPISSAISTLRRALVTSAWALGRSQKRFSTEPELTPMRIGVNSGSVEKRFWDLPKAQALVTSALRKVEIAEEMGFFDFKVSLKASHVPEMVEANRRFRKHSDAPLHLGVTEAGTRLPGAIKSAAALGQLLPYGIGDTIRISLAEDPVEEIPVAYQILSALDLRHRGPNVIACPSCARTLGFDVIGMAAQVEKKLKRYEDHFTVAVMGCVVNGPGEARDADYGVAGGKDDGVIFAKGQPLRKVHRDEIFSTLFEEIEKDGWK